MEDNDRCDGKGEYDLPPFLFVCFFPEQKEENYQQLHRQKLCKVCHYYFLYFHKFVLKYVLNHQDSENKMDPILLHFLRKK